MVQVKAQTVEQYLKELPPERREVIEAVRKVILKNLDKQLVEQMQYGMLSYCVPHSVFPDGYHCDPSQPLPFVCLAAQKNNYSLYLFCMYTRSVHEKQLLEAFKAIGKKPDMGKSCIRFKRLEDIPLDAIGKLIKGITAKKHIEMYQAALDPRTGKPKSTRKKK